MLLNLNRPNIRGIKKCRFCGYYNGNRSKSCKNENCPQFLECSRRSTKRVCRVEESPLDPITINSRDDVQYFSVRVADKGTPGRFRSLVKIEESTIKTDSNTVIICRTAVCFVDSCMTSVTNCRHIVECTGQRNKQMATGVPIIRTKFLKFFSHLTEAERNDLWDYYGASLSTAVQQLRGNLFVVRCPVPCGNKENSGGLNVTSGVTDFVHCELREMGRETRFSCSCQGTTTFTGNNYLCHHLLLLYSAIDSDSCLREKFKSHLNAACYQLDLHELDLLEMEGNLSLDWDLKADSFLEDMINEEILMDQSGELEFIGDIGDLLQETEEILLPANDKMEKNDCDGNGNLNCRVDKMTLSVSFDTILTSIIERMNCNFNLAGSDTTTQEFVFYVHNEFFACLSERFFGEPPHENGLLPCQTIFHGTGAYAGLKTHLYRFYEANTLHRIFTSKSAAIILDRIFHNYHNHHRGEVQAVDTFLGHHSTAEAIKKSIALPGGQSTIAEEDGVGIAWTADVLPASSHGELKISFRYDYVGE